MFNGTIQQKPRLADLIRGEDEDNYDRQYAKKDQPFSLPRNVDLDEETDLVEDPGQEKPMMMNSLRAMSHGLQGIAKYVAKTQDPEEWFQNKLAGVAKEMQTLYSYATAEVMSMGENLEEASCGCGSDCEQCGGDHADSKVGEDCDCCGKVIKEQSLADRSALAKAGETTKAGKKAVTLKKAPWEKKESIKENAKKTLSGLVEELNEKVTFKTGIITLDDRAKVKLSRQDADLLTKFFRDLNPRNSKEMCKVLVKDKSGFEEILGFAKEAL